MLQRLITEIKRNAAQEINVANPTLSLEVSKTNGVFNVKAIIKSNIKSKTAFYETIVCRYNGYGFDCSKSLPNTSALLIKISQLIMNYTSQIRLDKFNLIIKEWIAVVTLAKGEKLLEVSVFKDMDMILIADKNNLGCDGGSFMGSKANTKEQMLYVGISQWLWHNNVELKAA